jgi:putative transposase
LLGQIAADYGWQIVAHDVMPDQVHLFVRVGPADAPASAVRAVKGRTTRILRRASPQLRNHAKALWSPSYVAASVRYESATVRHQIEHPWDAVLAS